MSRRSVALKEMKKGFAAKVLEGDVQAAARLISRIENEAPEAFDDMNPWEQLMMLTTPLDGFGSSPETIFQTLARRPEQRILKQLAGLVASWTA